MVYFSSGHKIVHPVIMLVSGRGNRYTASSYRQILQSDRKTCESAYMMHMLRKWFRKEHFFREEQRADHHLKANRRYVIRYHTASCYDTKLHSVSGMIPKNTFISHSDCHERVHLTVGHWCSGDSQGYTYSFSAESSILLRVYRELRNS